MHKKMWALMEAPAVTKILLASYRGSSKTTRLRTFISKRIAYGLSKTIIYLGPTDDHALRSVSWIRGAVERNTFWAGTFGLEPGDKWQEHEAQIYRRVEDDRIWLAGFGVQGKGLRGLNFDDYRPDLIVFDDVITDENSGTVEQREKIKQLIFGAVLPALSPPSEATDPKAIMLQTPINAEDASSDAMQDPSWSCYAFPCWTPETLDLPVDEQVSSWEERYSTEFLRREKKNYIANNRLSIWLREYECKIVAAEKLAFRVEWLRTFDGPDPQGFTVIAIDPVPPPSAAQKAKNLLTKDWEIILVLRRHRGEYYVLDYARNRGHEPNWTVSKTMEFAARYRPYRIVPEAVGYQRVLEHLLRTEMARTGIYYAIVPVVDKRNKYNRIVSTLAGPASQGKIFIRESMTELRAEFAQYPGSSHDDILDALAIGIMNISQPHLETEDNDYYTLDESQYQDLTVVRRCP
jgi:hypothetical protein